MFDSAFLPLWLLAAGFVLVVGGSMFADRRRRRRALVRRRRRLGHRWAWDLVMGRRSLRLTDERPAEERAPPPMPVNRLAKPRRAPAPRAAGSLWIFRWVTPRASARPRHRRRAGPRR